MEEAKKIWVDGELIDWKDAKTHILTHSLHYGSAVFEGIRCYKAKDGPAIFRLEDHIQRLCESAQILMMKLPYSAEEFCDAVKKTVRANDLEECYIRPLLFRGYGAMGVNPLNSPVVCSIAVWKWGAYLGSEGLKRGIRARMSSFARSHINSMPTRAKASGNYLNAIMAKMEAVSDGYDEAILLDTDGNLAEGSGENLFLVERGRILTVAPRAILLGITRSSVMTLLSDMGHPVDEVVLTRGQLYTAEEAFFTGTAAEVTPIREVDHRTIGRDCPGPFTKMVQERYFDAVHGRLKQYRQWLTYV